MGRAMNHDIEGHLINFNVRIRVPITIKLRQYPRDSSQLGRPQFGARHICAGSAGIRLEADLFAIAYWPDGHGENSPLIGGLRYSFLVPSAVILYYILSTDRRIYMPL